MLDVKDRVVMISGANRGIGRAVAEVLYATGYRLSLGARDPRSLETVVEPMDGERVATHRYEAQDQASHKAWVSSTSAKFGRIDGLVNNAGVAIRVQVEDEKDESLDLMWAVNVKGPLSMIRTVLPHLRKSGSGRVINVASMAGKMVAGNNAGYAMSKFALVALSHATRRLGFEDGVRCTAICPSFVHTDMTADVESFPRDQMMEPGDIAQLVATVMALSNTASIAELVVNCKNDIVY